MNETHPSMSQIKEFVQFLSTLELNPSWFRNKTLEVDLRGRLNPTLWLDYVFFTQGQHLGFKTFFDYYVNRNEQRLRAQFADTDWEDLLKGLEARLYRTQFGLLTEYHAYFLCQDFFGRECVTRNAALDRIGVDFQLSLNGERYNIHIFVDTKRAWEYRRYKERFKKGNAQPGIHINLPYALPSGRFNSLEYLPNGFGIYTTAYLEYLQQEIMAGHIRDGNIIGTRNDGFVYQV